MCGSELTIYRCGCEKTGEYRYCDDSIDLLGIESKHCDDFIDRSGHIQSCSNPDMLFLVESKEDCDECVQKKQKAADKLKAQEQPEALQQQ